MSKDDESMTAGFLIIIGVPAFVVVTLAAANMKPVTHGKYRLTALLGPTWILLGAVLHAFVWLN